MGFTLNRTYALRFSGALEGLEVDIRSTSAAVMLELRETSMANTPRIAELLAEHIKRWNYEDEDSRPTPATVEGLLSVEQPVIIAIAKEWYRAATGVSAPLDEPSTSGKQFPEESLPMETL